jgi:predicted DNA-binding transcriptional regulator AlpA
MSSQLEENNVFLSARQVRGRYGNRSDMALWRWLRDEKLNFPKPIYINQFRYWKLTDLIAWERTRPSRNVVRRSTSDRPMAA